MFKAELSDPSILKTSFDAISSIVDEVQLQTDSEGVRLNALDRSHITFVHLELKASLFDEYVCDEPQQINIDTDELMKVLKRSKSNDKVFLSLEENNLVITFEGEAKRKFKIRLIDIEYDTPSPPPLTYPTEFDIPFALLKDSINDIDIFSDKITFMVNGDVFKATAEGEFGDANIEYIHGEKIETEASSVFSLEKVREMLKADKFSDIATISLGDDMPLGVSLKMISEDGELRFMLAPRIESDE